MSKREREAEEGGEMSATMADDQQHLLWRENRGDDDDNKMSDFPHNLISYVNNNQFLCDRGIFNRGFVFSTLQQHHPPSQPPPFSKIIDLDSETPIAANRELIGKIKSIMKWIVFCPGQFLVQFWKVIEIEGRRLLTTQDQPFGLSTTHEGLCSYRLISLNYRFYVDGESEADPGLPGRVFRHRRPESSPNVQYYSCKEYPQHDHDVISKVRRSWALPVLESSGQCCVGVLELVAAAEPKYPFTNLIDGIYKRVEEVGLRSSETCNHLYNNFRSFKVASGEELGEELSVEVIDSSKEDKLDSFQIPQIARSPDMMKNGGEMDYSGLSDQQLMEEDVIDIRNNVVLNTQINNIVVTSSQQKCITNPSQRQQRKAGFPISSEDIQQHVGMKLDDAAASLHDSQSTLKRACSEYGITGWSCRKRNKDNLTLSNKFVQGVAQEQIQESSQPPISDPPCKQDLATTYTKAHSMATQDTSIVTIKAKHGENFIKFKFPVLSGMVEFQQEVAKRLHLEDGTYSVRYQDDGNNWILIACDEELRDYISKSKSLGKNIVTMSLEPNYNKFVQGVAREQIRESSQPPISDRKQDLATTTCAKVHSMATQDIVTIKAKHGENFIKFKLSVLSGMVEFQQEVAKRLQLEDGTYSVKYQDDGNNWILIACDEELRDYISKSKSLGKNIVTMSLEPNYDELVRNVAQEQIQESSQPPIFDPPRKQDLATTCAKVHSLATQDTSTVTIKAKHGENFIKFKLPVLSGMVEFQQEVAKRLQLEDGTYSVKCQDDGNNWILIACDEELRDYISKSKSLGKNIVTMSLEPNCDILVQDAAQEQIRESSQPPISDPPRKQDLATTCAKVHSMATQDTSIVTIKAKHGENFIKFKLPVLSGMVEFQQEVAKRLHLEDGTYSVKYQDDGNNWILIARDEELRDYISKSKSLGKNIVTMLLQPITSCPP